MADVPGSKSNNPSDGKVAAGEDVTGFEVVPHPDPDAVRENGEIKEESEALQPEALHPEEHEREFKSLFSQEARAKILSKIDEMDEALTRSGVREEIEAGRSYTHELGDGWRAIVSVTVQVRRA